MPVATKYVHNFEKTYDKNGLKSVSREIIETTCAYVRDASRDRTEDYTLNVTRRCDNGNTIDTAHARDRGLNIWSTVLEGSAAGGHVLGVKFTANRVDQKNTGKCGAEVFSLTFEVLREHVAYHHHHDYFLEQMLTARLKAVSETSSREQKNNEQ